MRNNDSTKYPKRKAETGSGLLTNLLSVFGLALAFALILFLTSGRLDWWMAWIYISARVVIALVSTFMIRTRSPDLLEERFHPGKGVKTWDRPLSSITTLLIPAMLIISGLDERFGWSPGISLAFQLVGLLVLVLGDVFSKWAAVSNKFYSRLVRIQKDREQTVIRNGPYRYIRHPGYAGAIMVGLATPIVLSSWYALVAGVVQAILLVIRTALEDKTLHKELLGYPEYTQETRYRLMPGVW